MKKSGWLIVLILGLLCLVVPHSSRAPDAVQTLLRLPGGTDSFFKAVGGVLITVSMIYFLGLIFKRVKN
jgi:hypothetical protein